MSSSRSLPCCAVVVLLITRLKVHPFLALILGSATSDHRRIGAGKVDHQPTAGVGSTVGTVGLLIALGAMIGGLLSDSGGPIGLSVQLSAGSPGLPCPGPSPASPP